MASIKVERADLDLLDEEARTSKADVMMHNGPLGLAISVFVVDTGHRVVTKAQEAQVVKVSNPNPRWFQMWTVSRKRVQHGQTVRQLLEQVEEKGHQAAYVVVATDEFPWTGDSISVTIHKLPKDFQLNAWIRQQKATLAANVSLELAQGQELLVPIHVSAAGESGFQASIGNDEERFNGVTPAEAIGYLFMNRGPKLGFDIRTP